MRGRLRAHQKQEGRPTRQSLHDGLRCPNILWGEDQWLTTLPHFNRESFKYLKIICWYWEYSIHAMLHQSELAAKVSSDALKPLADALVSCCEDSDPKIRDGSALALAAMAPIGTVCVCRLGGYMQIFDSSLILWSSLRLFHSISWYLFCIIFILFCISKWNPVGSLLWRLIRFWWHWNKACPGFSKKFSRLWNLDLGLLRAVERPQPQQEKHFPLLLLLHQAATPDLVC